MSSGSPIFKNNAFLSNFFRIHFNIILPFLLLNLSNGHFFTRSMQHPFLNTCTKINITLNLTTSKVCTFISSTFMASLMFLSVSQKYITAECYNKCIRTWKGCERKPSWYHCALPWWDWGKPQRAFRIATPLVDIVTGHFLIKS